jgi:hypothetical protein
VQQSPDAGTLSGANWQESLLTACLPIDMMKFVATSGLYEEFRGHGP